MFVCLCLPFVSVTLYQSVTKSVHLSITVSSIAEDLYRTLSMKLALEMLPAAAAAAAMFDVR